MDRYQISFVVIVPIVVVAVYVFMRLTDRWPKPERRCRMRRRRSATALGWTVVLLAIAYAAYFLTMGSGILWTCKGDDCGVVRSEE
jgi:membrane protein implicated in regulation of membrane protease activity